MYKGLREPKWTRLRIFVFRDPSTILSSATTLMEDTYRGRDRCLAFRFQRQLRIEETFAASILSLCSVLLSSSFSFSSFVFFSGSRDRVNTRIGVINLSSQRLARGGFEKSLVFDSWIKRGSLARWKSVSFEFESGLELKISSRRVPVRDDRGVARQCSGAR